MAKNNNTHHAQLRLAILALVGGFEDKQPLSIGEIKEMLATQGCDEKEVHAKVQSMIVTGRLRLVSSLKIRLGKQPWAEGAIRADIGWAVAGIGRADRQVDAARVRRKEAIATLIEFSSRDFR